MLDEAATLRALASRLDLRQCGALAFAASEAAADVVGHIFKTWHAVLITLAALMLGLGALRAQTGELNRMAEAHECSRGSSPGLHFTVSVPRYIYHDCKQGRVRNLSEAFGTVDHVYTSAGHAAMLHLWSGLMWIGGLLSALFAFLAFGLWARARGDGGGAE